MKNEFYFELTNKEIKKVLTGFTSYINSNNSIIEEIKNADPIKENCYISSGAVVGVFFPNTEIILNKYYNFWDFACLGKNENNELGFWLSLKPEHYENNHPKGYLQEFCFIPFIVIDSKYFEIKKRIENDIQELKNKLFTLNSIKPNYKKNGSSLANINKWFTCKYKNKYTGTENENNIVFEASRSWGDSTITSIKITFYYNYEEYHYLQEKDKNKFLDVERYRNQNEWINYFEYLKNECIQRIEEKELILKNSLKIFRKAEALKDSYKKQKAEIKKDGGYYFNEYLKIESYE